MYSTFCLRTLLSTKISNNAITELSTLMLIDEKVEIALTPSLLICMLVVAETGAESPAANVIKCSNVDGARSGFEARRTNQ